VPKARSRSVTTLSSEIARDRPGDIVSDGRGADAALGADHGDDAANRLCVGRGKQSADRAHHVDGADRGYHVVTDAAPHQLPIERDVVGPPDDDDAGAGVAELGERIQASEDAVAAAVGLQHDHIGRRRAAIGFDRGGDAAHLNLDMGLAETTIFARRLDRGCRLDGFAKCLNGHPRRRRDVLFARRRLGRSRFRRDSLQ
jgi:hypothetical protein